MYPELGLSFSPDDLLRPRAERIVDSIFARAPFEGATPEGVRVGVPRASARAVLGPPEEVLLDGATDDYGGRGMWLHYVVDGTLDHFQLFAPR